jgi:Flp pilus assembly protein TadD
MGSASSVPSDRVSSPTLTEAAEPREAPASASHANGLVVQHQRRFAEAEQYHRQALDIELRFDGRDSAATN